MRRTQLSLLALTVVSKTLEILDIDFRRRPIMRCTRLSLLAKYISQQLAEMRPKLFLEIFDMSNYEMYSNKSAGNMYFITAVNALLTVCTFQRVYPNSCGCPITNSHRWTNEGKVFYATIHAAKL